MSRKKEIESYYYKKFAKAYGLPEECDDTKEKPDIRIKHNEKNIGIELTEFHLRHGADISSEQRQYPIREKVVEEAQKIFEKQNKSGVEVSLSFNTITNNKGLSKKIADWLASQEFTSSGALERISHSHIPELDMIYVNINQYEKPKWFTLHCYSPTNTSVEALQSIINKKEKDYENYDKQFDEIWLLIVIDYIRSAMDQEPCNVDYSGVCVTKFNRVILYKTGYDTIIELPVNNQFDPIISLNNRQQK